MEAGGPATPGALVWGGPGPDAACPDATVQLLAQRSGASAVAVDARAVRSPGSRPRGRDRPSPPAGLSGPPREPVFPLFGFGPEGPKDRFAGAGAGARRGEAIPRWDAGGGVRAEEGSNDRLLPVQDYFRFA